MTILVAVRYSTGEKVLLEVGLVYTPEDARQAVLIQIPNVQAVLALVP